MVEVYEKECKLLDNMWDIVSASGLTQYSTEINITWTKNQNQQGMRVRTHYPLDLVTDHPENEDPNV